MCLEALDISLVATERDRERDGDGEKDHLSRLFLRRFQLKKVADERELSVVIR